MICYGECVECLVRHKDPSEKELHQCSYCERTFCLEHSEPKLVHIPNFDSIIKDSESKALEMIFKREYSIEGNHPCFQYTMAIFDEMKLQEQMRERLIKEAIDRMMATEPWWKKFQEPLKPMKIQTLTKSSQKRSMKKIWIVTIGLLLLGLILIPYFIPRLIPQLLDFLGIL